MGSYPKYRKVADPDKRFWSKVDKTPTCWLWTGAPNAKGYGRHGVGRFADGDQRMILAHRYSWELKNGAIQDELCVLHKCDTPACVRPAHLFLGTRAENNADMMAKGRQVMRGWAIGRERHPERWPRGEAVAGSKLTEANVKQIRALYAAGGTSYVKLAKQFGVGRTAIECVVKRWKWAHV